MGAILQSYFDKAKEKGGLNAQVKLAMITKMSSEKAKAEPDSASNIKLFEDALNKLS
jgi:hypothetical protein